MHHVRRSALGATVLVATVLVLAFLATAVAQGSGSAARTGFISEVVVTTVPKHDIDALSSDIAQRSGAAACDVTVREIVHTTTGPNGGTYEVSAGLYEPIPSATCPGPFPLLSFNRGTATAQHKAMSAFGDDDAFPGIGATAIQVFAAHGYVVIATDYLGFARSTFPYHPYMHAASQATTTIDAILAARSSLQRRGVPMSDRLFLAGYSQGGHAAMATQRAIEADPALGLTVTAAGTMSGPYNVARQVRDVMNDAWDAPAPQDTLVATYILTAYQQVYGTLYASPDVYFIPPYDEGIEALLPTRADTLPPGVTPYGPPWLFSIGRIHWPDFSSRCPSSGPVTWGVDCTRLPYVMAYLLTDRLRADVGDPDHPLSVALQENTLLDWRPEAPVLLCGGGRDATVDFQNSIDAYKSMVAAGATVELVDVEAIADFDHALSPKDRHYTPYCDKDVDGSCPRPQLRLPVVLHLKENEIWAFYHEQKVPPLCMDVVRDRLFDPLR
jgi:pimeloyl-ACP methyl ester carboxylesterase